MNQKRVPAGSPDGGQFGEGGGGSGGGASEGGGGGGGGGGNTKEKRFTEQQEIELKDYAEGNYQPLNAYLRNPASVRESLGKEYEKQAKTIDSAIAKSTLTKDVTVYRGIQSPKVVANAEKLIGRTLEAPGYSSTSMSDGVAKNFAGLGSGAAVLELRAKKGTNAIDMERFKRTGNSGEQEVLFGRNSSIKITGVDRTRRPPVIKGEFV